MATLNNVTTYKVKQIRNIGLNKVAQMHGLRPGHDPACIASLSIHIRGGFEPRARTQKVTVGTFQLSENKQ